MNTLLEVKYLVETSKRIGKVFNPATGEQSAEVKLASTKDVNQAVSNAKKAFEPWSNTPPATKSKNNV